MFSDEKNYLNRLIARGEGQHLDFKYHVAEAEKIAKSLVAFANSSGGKLLIGVKDNGRVKGVATDEEVYMIETAAHFYCSPEVGVEMTEKNFDNKTVLEVNVEESRTKPHYAKEENGRWMAYIRFEDKNLLANKVLLDVMRRKREGYTTRLEYTDKEHDLLSFIREKGTMTIRSYVKHSGVPYKKVQRMLVDLICIGVVIQHIEPGRKYYTLRESVINRDKETGQPAHPFPGK